MKEAGMDRTVDLVREKILVVDDTRVDRAMAADVLARVGYSTVEVESGAHALELVQVESPDLILLDSDLPELDGLTVCRHLKSDPFTKHIPVLISSSDQSLLAKITALRAGADGHLCKPLVAEELVVEVEALLRRSFDFDPLTRLPSAPYMHRQIDSRLAQNLPTAIAYADIDHFRAFNQACGHDAGDRLLVETAKLLVGLLPARDALAGHLGMDEFIAVLAPEQAETLAQAVVDKFTGLHKLFYKEADLQRGAVFIENRRGDIIQHPLITLSLALVTNEHKTLNNYVHASELLAEVMGLVKSQGGGKWARDRRVQQDPPR